MKKDKVHIPSRKKSMVETEQVDPDILAIEWGREQ